MYGLIVIYQKRKEKNIQSYIFRLAYVVHEIALDNFRGFFLGGRGDKLGRITRLYRLAGQSPKVHINKYFHPAYTIEASISGPSQKSCSLEGEEKIKGLIKINKFQDTNLS